MPNISHNESYKSDIQNDLSDTSTEEENTNSLIKECNNVTTAELQKADNNNHKKFDKISYILTIDNTA